MYKLATFYESFCSWAWDDAYANGFTLRSECVHV